MSSIMTRKLKELKAVVICFLQLCSIGILFPSFTKAQLTPFSCSPHRADCNSCLTEGCFFCPLDGRCLWSDGIVVLPGTMAVCTEPADFISGDADLCIPNDAVTRDPLYTANQWMYEMINVIDAWAEGYTGKGVTIRVNDDGVDVDHDEFDGRFDDVQNSCPDYLPDTIGDGHGTGVTGILLGNANNEDCAVGIAYEAKFSSCDVINKESNVFTYNILEYKLDTFDISQNSWGTAPCFGEGWDDYIDEDIIYDEGCPFQAGTLSDSDHPCTVCDGEFTSQDRDLTVECESAIENHCDEFFRQDEDACLNFPQLIFNSHCEYRYLDENYLNAFENGIENGRDGKGTIFTFASGNDYESGEDVNLNGITNTRYTISVGAVAKDGLHTSYSTPGAALVVSAPVGGERDTGNLLTAGIGNTCKDSDLGTSFSTPIVSGVIALMLQANPDLSWRDVQGIIAQTSTNVDDDRDDTDTRNAAGFWHSNWYGFGIVNAKAAVDAALDWDLFTEELQVVDSRDYGDNGYVLSDNEGSCEFVTTIQIDGDDTNDDFIIESTVVRLELSHYNRGDLEIILESPSGTVSVLHPGRRPEDTREDALWELMTVRNWGENPHGEWTLTIRDLVDREDNTDAKPDDNVFKQWDLVIYGRMPSSKRGKSSKTKADKSEKAEKADKANKSSKGDKQGKVEKDAIIGA